MAGLQVVDDVAEQRRRVLGDRHSQVVDPVGRVQEIEEEVQVLGTHGTGEYSCEGDGAIAAPHGEEPSDQTLYSVPKSLSRGPELGRGANV